MTPPTVLLDRSFLDALVDPDEAQHHMARHSYARMLDRYQAGAIRLRARADHLARVQRAQYSELLAPLEPIHVARQYRRQAARLPHDVDPDVAVTLVVMRRESITRVATFDPYFANVDVTIELTAETPADTQLDTDTVGDAGGARLHHEAGSGAEPD